VLRYWLAALRLEEALRARPDARPSTSGTNVPRLDHPTPGQDYFKVPLDAELVELLSKDATLARPFDAELCGFFETWLHRRYRRRDDESELSHLLCFPVVYLPKGQLAGLLRRGVRLRFGSAGQAPFRVPGPAERQRGSYPPPPDEARLTRAANAESWPFFIDTRLLRQPLGVPAESIDALFEALRAAPQVSEQLMLALVTTLLERVAEHHAREPTSAREQAARLTTLVARETCGLEVWLERLTRALGRLLEQSGSRARAYGVGIVVDGTQAKTTWHLQRELESLLEGERGGWQVGSPLGAYLTGRALPSAEAPQRALFPGPALSSSQLAAAEAFWGSRLSALQGPPGTGKTRLILHLCAEALVRQVEGLLGVRQPGRALFLITSSNNRAVDNVVDPLAAAEGLPLALRAGSRQVCEQQLLPQLRRALAWLERAALEPPAERAERLTRAKAHFRAQRDALERQLASHRAARERAAKRAELARELEQCETPREKPSGSGSRPARAKAALLPFELVEKRLRRLSELCEATPTAGALETIELHFKRTTKRHLPALIEALDRASLTLNLPLPPTHAVSVTDAAQRMAEWEEAAEQGLSQLAELRLRLEASAIRAGKADRAQHLRARLAALGPEPTPAEDVLPTRPPPSLDLFAAAVAAREAWASEHASELIRALSTTLRIVEQERSLRSLFRSELEAARLLGALFGIWGSTLLSLGNCFPNELRARVVIDEAGQCHPAHAVSALVRAESALVIGDVNQLSPVFELAADDDARLLRSCKLGTPAPRLLPYRVHADATSSSQSLADRAVSVRGSLTDHFRCQQGIIRISDALCGYGLTIHTPPADRSQNAPFLRHPVSLVDLRGQQVPVAGSWSNEAERQETLALVETLLRAGIGPEEVAVITPYRGQLEQLRRAFSQRNIPVESSPELVETDGAAGAPRGLALGTVHRFQGGERSVVLFSSVVTHPASLPFLNARPNLLNVAVSRARHHFVCLGHAAVLGQGERSRLLVERARLLSPADYGGNG